MYHVCATFAGFNQLSPSESIDAIQSLVDSLVIANIGYLRSNPDTPLLYDSGVSYCVDKAGAERLWLDIPAALEHGCADCKSLAAWRAAELRVRGYPAKATVVTNDGILFHVIVQYGNIEEDPSAILGM